MRIGLPHVGNLYVPMRALMQELDVDHVIPPANSRRTMSLGVKYSPEGLCIPFKLTLGNMVEAAELGADTILMAGGSGICRLGYYAKSQEQILRDLGYNVEIVQLGVSQQKLLGFLKMVRRLSNNAPWTRIISAFRFGLAKLYALDEIEHLVQKVRAVEVAKGTANRLYAKAIDAIDKASDHSSLKRVRKDYLEQLNKVEKDKRTPLIVGITGEFYVVLEPFSNLDVESELGKLGVEVRRSLFISKWTKFSWFLNPLGVNENDRIHQAAMTYLKRDIGG
ncbi:MAG: CoA protein activase [Chloroflexota bacterium]|nr:CoA protein activase [Chloroflexota bacterium]